MEFGKRISMKLIYTDENRFLVVNMQNIMTNAGIDVTLKNEFAFGGVGELSPFDAWLELWVLDEQDYERAMDIMRQAQSQMPDDDWTCTACNEVNASSFESCWQCQSSKAVVV